MRLPPRLARAGGVFHVKHVGLSGLGGCKFSYNFELKLPDGRPIFRGISRVLGELTIYMKL